MEWTADVAAGDWIRERLDDAASWGRSMHGFVPRGFAAYARVFHRPSVTTLAGGAVPPADEWVRLPASTQQELVERMSTEPTTWADTARVFGTTLHPRAQWNRIVREESDDPNAWQQAVAGDGRQYRAPAEGELDPEVLAAVAEHLVAHTATPDDAHVAVWEGWGGLLGFLGEAPSRTWFSWPAGGEEDAAVLDRHNEMLGRSVPDRFNNVFRKPTWQPGILSDEISRGPRLELPGRDHVLFRGGVRELARPDWVRHVPWRDVPGEEHGFPPWAQSPSLVWPDDRAWVLVTEVDDDSTIVGGSLELVAALCADPRIEAMPVPEGADLSWAGDVINR
ncbi:MAG: hypothetical protein QM602_09865 [Microbacterium sp.]